MYKKIHNAVTPVNVVVADNDTNINGVINERDGSHLSIHPSPAHQIILFMSILFMDIE